MLIMYGKLFLAKPNKVLSIDLAKLKKFDNIAYFQQYNLFTVIIGCC